MSLVRVKIKAINNIIGSFGSKDGDGEKHRQKKQLVSRAKQQPCMSITLHDTFLGSQTDYDLKFSRATFHGGLEQRTTKSPFLSFYHNLTN